MTDNQVVDTSSRLDEDEMARLKEIFDKTQASMERLGASGSWVTAAACT